MIKNQNKDIFLSHSSLDKKVVLKIAKYFKEKNLEVWLDQWDISFGEDIVKKLNEGIQNSKILLLFFSKNSKKSKWVEKEWQSKFYDETNKDNVSVIVVILDNETEIPPILKQKKHLFFDGVDFSQIDLLINQIKEMKNYEIEQSESMQITLEALKNDLISQITNKKHFFEDVHKKITSLNADPLKKLQLLKINIKHTVNEIEERIKKYETMSKEDPSELSLLFYRHSLLEREAYHLLDLLILIIDDEKIEINDKVNMCMLEIEYDIKNFKHV